MVNHADGMQAIGRPQIPVDRNTADEAAGDFGVKPSSQGQGLPAQEDLAAPDGSQQTLLLSIPANPFRPLQQLESEHCQIMIVPEQIRKHF